MPDKNKEGINIDITSKQLIVSVFTASVVLVSSFISAYIYIDKNYVQKELYEQAINDRKQVETDLKNAYRSFENVKMPAVLNAFEDKTNTSLLEIKNRILEATSTPLMIRRDVLLQKITSEGTLTPLEKAELRKVEEKLIELGESITITNI